MCVRERKCVCVLVCVCVCEIVQKWRNKFCQSVSQEEKKSFNSIFHISQAHSISLSLSLSHTHTPSLSLKKTQTLFPLSYLTYPLCLFPFQSSQIDFINKCCFDLNSIRTGKKNTLLFYNAKWTRKNFWWDFRKKLHSEREM